MFIIWLTLLPLFFWQGSYEGPKILWFLIGGVGLSIFWIYRIVIQKRSINFSKADLFYFLWLLTLTFSSLFGIHPFESIVGGSYRHQGVIFFLALWLIGKTVGILKKSQRKTLTKYLGVVILTESLIVIFGYPLGTLGEANAVSGMLAIGLYFVYKSFPKLYLILPIVTILLSHSRAGTLALAPYLWKIRKYLLLILIPVVILFSSGKGISYFENRSIIWKLAAQSILKKPVLGYGAESGEKVFNTAFYQSGFPLSDLVIDRAHNIFLDVLMWSGVIGLFFFCCWFYSERKATILPFLIYALFQPLSVIHWILLIIIVNI